MLKELKSKTISFQLAESDNDSFMKQNSIEHNNTEAFYGNYLEKKSCKFKYIFPMLINTHLDLGCY